MIHGRILLWYLPYIYGQHRVVSFHRTTFLDKIIKPAYLWPGATEHGSNDSPTRLGSAHERPEQGPWNLAKCRLFSSSGWWSLRARSSELFPRLVSTAMWCEPNQFLARLGTNHFPKPQQLTDYLYVSASLRTPSVGDFLNATESIDVISNAITALVAPDNTMLVWPPSISSKMVSTCMMAMQFWTGGSRYGLGSQWLWTGLHLSIETWEEHPTTLTYCLVQAPTMPAAWRFQIWEPSYCTSLGLQLL